MNSRNHHMFSSVSEWIVSTAGGLKSKNARAVACGAAANLELSPAAIPGLSSASFVSATACGDVAMSYQRHGGDMCGKTPEGQSAARPGAPVVEDLVR